LKRSSMLRIKNRWLNLSRSWKDRRKRLRLKLRKISLKLNNRPISKRKRRIS